ncbi:MAG: hypothetical protein DMD54_17140 [Gemmatimonadetes bacterium]|nr:MAG: hypothetical protein DMD54_17140 [Gemmatimonadota bacterium]
MGQHYVQQAFLRQWETPSTPGWIWTYIRGVDEPRLLPIGEVAQAPGFYDDDVERELARLVEGPTTPILDVLRRGEELDAAGRRLVAVYVVTCIKRVPRHRERGLEMLPKQLDEIVARTRADLPLMSGGDPVKLENLRTAIDVARAKFEAEPPPEISDYLRDPRPTREQVEVILRMSWRLLNTDPSEPFQPLRLGGTVEPRHAERALVHEINRRMANDATKLLFASMKAKFPLTLLSKGHGQYLSRINWTYK